MTGLYVISVLGLLILGVVSRLTRGSWLAPGTLMALLWGSYAGVTGLYVVDFEPMIPALLWVYFACLAFYVGDVLGSHCAKSLSGAGTWDRTYNPLDDGSREGDLEAVPGLLIATTICLVAGIAEIAVIFTRTGISPQDLLSVGSVIEAIATNRARFVYGDAEQGFSERILFSVIYASTLFGGLTFRLRPSATGRLLGLGTLLVAFVVPTLYGSRFGVLFGGAYWLSAYVAAEVLAAPRTGKGATFLGKLGAASVVVLLGLSLLTQLLRYRPGTVTIQRMLADPFGFLTAFALWFSDGGWSRSGPMLGYRTFERLYQWLGFSFPRHATVEVGFTSSNIFTVLRGLIEDFSLPGALMWLIGLGFLGGWAYQTVLRGHTNALPILAFVYAFLFTSFALSILSYTTTVAALLYFSFYLTVIQRVRARSPHALRAPA